MIIKSLAMNEGMWAGKYDLYPLTIIYNAKNRQGKTTFLRCLLYALGYPIPSTLGMHFERIEFVLTLTKDDGTDCIVKRLGNVVDVSSGLTTKTYSLPSGQMDLQGWLFGLTNELLIENLLGAYYFDQEKGWTLLNRGKVIGSVHFSIEDFLRGLSDRPCLQEYKNLQAVVREIQKYKQMLEVAQYQVGTKDRREDIPFEAPSLEIRQELDRLHNERRPIDDELARLQNVIRKNTSFKNYISAMQLRVKGPGGILIPVNEETIDGFQLNDEFLQAKRRELKLALSVLDNKIDTLARRLDRESDLVNVETSIEHFDAEIARIRIDRDSVERILRDLQKKQKVLAEALRESIARGNNVVDLLRKLICKYLVEFGVDEKLGHNIFTHDIKSLTGAFFHMIVFAYKISYAKLVKDVAGITLPIIVDSPSGREVEREKVNKMLSVLTRDFKDHQIIIATIYNPQLPGQSVVEIKERVMKMIGADASETN